MSHIYLLYAPEDHMFAHQLAVQLQQRGLVIWPVPDPSGPEPGVALDERTGFETASHVLGILSPAAVQSEPLQAQCQAALASEKHVIAVLNDPVKVPKHLRDCPTVDFQEPFLLAVESLVKRLKTTQAPTRPLTVEHPPPVSKPSLLPNTLPSERCWRDDRLRINYTLPIILSRDEMELRIPAFLVHARFELTRSGKKSIRARRKTGFPLFDPRRAVHTITVRRRKGGLNVYYRMTRVQVYHWFPAHYHVLNREAAALYRYLVTGQLEATALHAVQRQATRARRASWLAIAGFVLALVVLGWLIII